MALAVIQIWTQVCLQSIKKDNDVIFNFLTVHDLDIWRLNLNYMDNLVFIQSWMLRILKLDLGAIHKLRRQVFGLFEPPLPPCRLL